MHITLQTYSTKIIKCRKETTIYTIIALYQQNIDFLQKYFSLNENRNVALVSSSTDTIIGRITILKTLKF